MSDINGTPSAVPGEIRSAAAALGHPDQQAMVIRTLQSLLVERLRFGRQHGLSFGDARSMNSVLGYDETLTTARLRIRYERGGIAGRVVDAMPKATWREGFLVYEDEDPDVSTPFEEAVLDLTDRLELSAKFLKADILASLSTFSVLLIGTKDGQLDKPLPKAKGNADNLIFLQPFLGGGGIRNQNSRTSTVSDDADCFIQTYVTDFKDPRFGLPQEYQIRRVYTADGGYQRSVHWTRVLHVAHNTLDDNVFGAPSLERVWNLLDDLDKVTGGGAEAFWLRANQGTALNIDADAALSDKEKETLKSEVEEFHHQIRRFMVMRKAELQTLGSDVANFASPADAIITQIAGAKGIPKRILTGSEMGELASSQDRENWRDQVHGRQKVEAGPYIIRPFFQRLLEYGYLPPLQKKNKSFLIDWPQIAAMTEPEKADGALKWSQTKAVTGIPVFTNDEIREKWYGMEPIPEDVQKEMEAHLTAVADAQQNAKERRKSKETEGPPRLKAAEEAAENAEILRILEKAIEVGNTNVVEHILGVKFAPESPMVVPHLQLGPGDGRLLGGPGSGWYAENGHVPGSQHGRQAPAGAGPARTADPPAPQPKATLSMVKSELEMQEELAKHNTNPLAHPPFVLGVRDSPALKNYVAAYGQEFKGIPLPSKYEMGPQKECYKNASLLVLNHPELTYVEGWAQSSATGDMSFLHAWAVDKNGNAIDNTWPSHDQQFGPNKYFGVKYERSAYLKYLYKAKIYGVLGSTDKNALKAITTGGAALRALANWDEGKHPRNPGGSPGGAGGEFKHKESGEHTTMSNEDLAMAEYPPANNAQTALEKQGGIDSLHRFTMANGQLTPERKALHERIIEEQLGLHGQQEFPASGMTGGGGASGKTRMITNLTGGGGASGKSVMQKELDIPKDSVHVDVDIIREKLPEWDLAVAKAKAEGKRTPELLGLFTHEEASMISKQVIDRAIEHKNNLLVDGAGDSGIEKLTQNVERYKRGGRTIVANYVTVDYDKAYARMRARGDETGRYIPAYHLKAVHANVSRTFPEAIKRGLFDKFTLWDTNDSVEIGRDALGKAVFSQPLKVVSGRGKKMTIHNQLAWDKFLAKGNMSYESSTVGEKGTKDDL